MIIYVNEEAVTVNDNDKIFKVKEIYKSDADLIILNGFPIKEDIELKENDRVVLIKKGEVPSKEQLEILMRSRHTPGIHEALKKAVVGVAGLGGLGSNIAISLARIGVGKLILVDFDIVEPSNLNRQQYYVEHIGLHKTLAIKELISKINPYVEIVDINAYLDEGNIEEIFKEADLILEAFDNPICKATLVNIVLTKMKDKIIIGASGMAGYFSSNTIKTRKVNSRFYLVGDETNEAKIGSGLMAPRVAIAANHMANMATRIIIGETDE